MTWRCYAPLIAAAWLGCSACQPEEAWELPQANDVAFREDVYPILLRDCGFHACHGSSDRFFRVWGPGRVRLAPNAAAFDDATSAEERATFQRAISMIDANDPGRSLLLVKALATEAGGSGHLGVDKFGRNVYRSANSPGYIALATWVFSIKAK